MGQINNIFCSATAILLLLFGIYITIKTKLFPIRKCKFIIKNTFGAITKDSFRAFATSIAGTIGIGNIVGVTGAIRIGGAGAVFWIWVSAWLSMMIKYCEIFLTLKNRSKQNIGPLCYMKKAIKNKTVLSFYAALTIISSLLLGNMTQIGAVADYIEEYSGVTPLLTGTLLTVITAILICRSADKISGLLAAVVPAMGALYILGGAIVICCNAQRLPYCFSEIFTGAFTPGAAVGGAFGSGMLLAARKGCMNGLFSHEAGVGSSAYAHTQALSAKPENEGLWGIIEVFADSILISTITALILLCSGLETSGAPSILYAFSNTFGTAGAVCFIVSVFLFAVTAMMSWSYYGRCALNSLTTKHTNLYLIIYLICTFVATVIDISPIWEFSETINSIMLLINLYAIFRLRKTIQLPK